MQKQHKASPSCTTGHNLFIREPCRLAAALFCLQTRLICCNISVHAPDHNVVCWQFLCLAEIDRLRQEGYNSLKAAYYMKHIIGNAYDTIGLLHALANTLVIIC